jgi:hypothetical protein
MIVYSLDPEGLGDKTPGNFHGCKVLGLAAVDCADTRARISSEVVAANLASDGGVKCFDPTHGIRATCQGQVVDLVACFWCSQLEVIGPAGVWGGFVPVTGQPQQLLDKILRQAGVPLANPPKF